MKVYFLAFGNQLFQHHCLNNLFFSTELPLKLCWKSIVHVCVGADLFLNSILFHRCLCLYINTTPSVLLWVDHET